MADLSVQYPYVTDCFALEKQIQILKYDIDYYRQNFDSAQADSREVLLGIRQRLFESLKCQEQIEKKRQLDTKQIFDKYSGISEERITTDSKKTRNVLFLISAVTILAGTFIIIKFKNK